MQNTEETIFPSAEWEVRHGRGHANVDADISRRGFVAKFSCGRATGGKQRSLVPIRTVVQKLHSLVYGIRVNQAQHRAKNFCVRQFAGWWHAIKYGGLDKIAAFHIGNFCVASINDGLGSFGYTSRD